MATPPEEFAISLAEIDGRAHMTLRGELDLATAPELEQLLTERIDAKQDVVVDLRGLEFMDSSGIRVLVRAMRVSRTNDVELAVCVRSSSPIHKVLELSGVIGVVPIVEDC